MESYISNRNKNFQSISFAGISSKAFEFSIELRKKNRRLEQQKKRLMFESGRENLPIENNPSSKYRRDLTINHIEILRTTNSEETIDLSLEKLKSNLSEDIDIYTEEDLSDVLSAVIDFCQSFYSESIVSNTCWILANIAYKSTTLADKVMDKIDLVIDILKSFPIECNESCLWLICNLAADSIASRATIINKEVLEILDKLIVDWSTMLGSLRNVLVWLFSVIYTPDIDPRYPGLILRKVYSLVEIQGVSADMLTIYANFCENIDFIDTAIKFNACGYALAALKSHKEQVLYTGLKLIGNICNGRYDQVQQMIDTGFVDSLHILIVHPSADIRKSICWVLSNITAGPDNHVRYLILHPLFLKFVVFLLDSDEKVHEEASIFIANIVKLTNRHDEIVMYLMNLFSLFSQCLTKEKTASFLVNLVDVFGYSWTSAKKLDRTERFREEFESSGCLDAVQALDSVSNEALKKKIDAFLVSYLLEA